MTVPIVVALAIFAGMLLITWVGYQAVEEDRRAKEKSAAERPVVTDVGQFALQGHCVLCRAPLPRPLSTDQVIHELERRIDMDTEEVAGLLKQFGPENVTRLYRC